MRRLSFAVVSISALVAASGAACGSSTSGNNGGGDGGSPGNQNPADSGASTMPSGDATVAPNNDSGGNGNGDGAPTNDDSSTPGPFDAGPVSTVYPGPHPAWPVIIDQGGPVLTTPNVLTVTFNADTNATTFNAFGAQATASTNAYWNTVRAGFCETGTTTCVGTGTGTSKAVTETLAASYADYQSSATASPLQTFIQSLITAGKITVTANTLAVFYFPATTTITLAQDATDPNPASSCQQFGGYHNSMTTTGTKPVQFTYAILPECAAQPMQTLTVAQETTLAASHEIIEAATDPFATDTSSGYYLNFNDLQDVLTWNQLGGGEVGDMCVDLFWGLGQDEYTEDTYTVQRMWNVPAAAAGGDPCVPAQPTTKPYFNTAPEQWLITEAVGATTTFDADAFSNMAVPAGWNVVGYDLNATSATDLYPYLGIALNGGAPGAQVTTNNGQKVQVAITLKTDPGALTQSAGGALGLILSFSGASPETATAGTFWPFLVQSPQDAEDSGLTDIDGATDMPRHQQMHAIRLSKAQLEHAWKTIREIYK